MAPKRTRLDAELVRRKIARSREQAKTWDYDGWVAARADEKAVSKRVGTDLARTERAPVSATFRLSGGSPQVVPARDGARMALVVTASGGLCLLVAMVLMALGTVTVVGWLGG